MNELNQEVDAEIWHLIGSVEDFPKGEIRGAQLPSGSKLAIYNVENNFYASFDRCTHGQASFVEEGELTENILECGWHMGTFDVRTGEARSLPCRATLITFATKVEDQDLYVSIKPNKRQRKKES